ncbi:hypothetical protein DMA11_07165 [Marinilabiliaceae bacterium JC017]|nr:hypothetical protein DMA11_07165 [Marinilabiliaceae bacterium JC017]
MKKTVKMEKMNKHIWLVLVVLMAFTSCSQEEDLGESLIDTSTPQLNEVDKWIRDNYTTPYNVEVKYRWDDSEVDNSKVLTPPKLEMVQPFLEAMKKVWIDPYEAVGGEDFVKWLLPKQIILVGSHNYNPNGSIILGQAENGRKVTIFELNYFDASDDKILKRQFETMEHEFGHILHQTVMYPVEYKKITPAYTSSWFNTTKSEALRQGYISPYSKSNPDDDFVELIAKMLTNSKEDWDKLVESAYAYGDEQKKEKEEGIGKLRKKELFVANYFLQVWKIDIYELQALVHQATMELKESANQSN